MSTSKHKRAAKLKYVEGEPWQQTLGLRRDNATTWAELLSHIVTETGNALRARGLDPDSEFSDPTAYQQPLVRECIEAYRLARGCIENPSMARLGFHLAQVWTGQPLAEVAAPALLLQQRVQFSQTKGRQLGGSVMKARADRELLQKFANWHKRAKAVLRENGKPFDATRCVDAYLTTQKPARRERQRLKRLLAEGRIPIFS